MHGTGVYGASWRFRRRFVFVEIFGGIRCELGAATGRTEVEGLAAMVEVMLRGRGIDAHAADGIAHLFPAGGSMIVLPVAGVSAAAGLRFARSRGLGSLPHFAAPALETYTL
jgi:hypothetical protein